MKTPWQQCKDAVFDLKANYEDVIKDAKRVKKMINSDGEVVTVYFDPMFGYEVELEVKYHKDNGVMSAKYFAFNEETSSCYVRDLLKQDLDITSSGKSYEQLNA